MSLSSTEAKKLFKLGYTRLAHEETAYPQDMFELNNEKWVVGGRLIPNTVLLSKREIYEKGLWIPSLSDLISWLEYNECQFILSYSNNVYKINVIDVNNREFRAKGGTVEFAYYNVLTKILEVYKGHIINKDIDVIEGEVVDIENL